MSKRTVQLALITPDTEGKVCTKCGMWQPLTEYYRNGHATKDGYRGDCKDCVRNERRANPERLNRIRRLQRNLPPGHKLCTACEQPLPLDMFPRNGATKDGRSSHCRPCNTLQHKERSSASPKARLRHCLSNGRSEAKRKGLSHEITIDDLTRLWRFQEGRCRYTGIPMVYDGEGRPESVSIDRVDSSLGYVRSNVVLCCVYVNRMKNDKTVTEFLDWCRRVLDHMEPGNRSKSKE